MKYKKYDKDFDYSYIYGAFPTIEYLRSGKKLKGLIISDKCTDNADTSYVINRTKKQNAPILTDNKTLSNLSGKENCFMIGVFDKYTCTLDNNNHVVLVNPMDAGNMGTIIRTMLGLGLNNLVIVGESVDIFNPKVIRASMGAVFKINFKKYATFDEYILDYPNHKKYAFCLNGKEYLQNYNSTPAPYSLVFGNEGSGLPQNVIDNCTGIKIKQTDKIDSFNLAISVAMALYHFTSLK